MDNKNNNVFMQIIKALTFMSQLGIRIAVCLLIGVLLGKHLDLLFGTPPWFVLVFSLLGMAAAFKLIFDLSKKI